MLYIVHPVRILLDVKLLDTREHILFYVFIYSVCGPVNQTQTIISGMLVCALLPNYIPCF